METFRKSNHQTNPEMLDFSFLAICKILLRPSQLSECNVYMKKNKAKEKLMWKKQAKPQIALTKKESDHMEKISKNDRFSSNHGFGIHCNLTWYIFCRFFFSTSSFYWDYNYEIWCFWPSIIFIIVNPDFLEGFLDKDLPCLWFENVFFNLLSEDLLLYLSRGYSNDIFVCFGFPSFIYFGVDRCIKSHFYQPHFQLSNCYWAGNPENPFVIITLKSRNEIISATWHHLNKIFFSFNIKFDEKIMLKVKVFEWQTINGISFDLSGMKIKKYFYYYLTHSDRWFSKAEKYSRHYNFY